jgi:NAD(P)-dependent dehydrogenase (short-subunit alcohol dehydrogenase family)
LLTILDCRSTIAHARRGDGAEPPEHLVGFVHDPGQQRGAAGQIADDAGIMGYTRHLAAHRSDVVRANAVAPGMTDTLRLAGFAASDIGQRVLARIPLHRMASPDEISWAILFLLSPLASYINGVLLTVDGGWTVTQ